MPLIHRSARVHSLGFHAPASHLAGATGTAWLQTVIVVPPYPPYYPTRQHPLKATRRQRGSLKP